MRADARLRRPRSGSTLFRNKARRKCLNIPCGPKPFLFRSGVLSESSPILVFGHLCPDTDSVISALAAAELLNGRGIPAEAAMPGPLTPESAFVLRRFSLPCPPRVDSAAGRRVALVDFSNAGQGPADLREADIAAVFDHHRCDGDIASRAPELWLAPVACCATLLAGLFRFYDVVLPPGLAGGMLCAILSDTSLFKSSAATPQDLRAAEDLARRAGVADIAALGADLLTAKADISGCTMRELVLRDFKDFTMNGRIVGVGQLEMPDITPVEPLKGGLLAACAELAAEGRHSVMLAVTDLGREGSLILAASPRPDLFELAFGRPLHGGEAWIAGMISRKSDMVRPLRKAFESLGRNPD